MSVRRILLINQPEIGKLIRELRLENQLTQEEFAAELGTTYSSVNR
ncbi:helix-turn-helix transcriptional regulator [Chroococcidiopsis sp. CCALA 051]